MVSSWAFDCHLSWECWLVANLGKRTADAERNGRNLTIMIWLINKLRIPASESSMGMVLALCAVTLSLMSVALVWQAQVIANQRVTIRLLEQVRFGG